MAESEEQNELIMNATFELGGVTFCANDIVDNSYKEGGNIALWLELESEEDLDKTNEQLLNSKCKVITPLEETFWNAVYTKVQDPFGIVWELNYQK